MSTDMLRRLTNCRLLLLLLLTSASHPMSSLLIRHEVIPIPDHKKKHFRWWNLLEATCMCRMVPLIISVLVCRKSVHFLTNMTLCRKNDFFTFRPHIHSDLDLWPLDLKFAPLVSLIQCYVCIKLEVSTAFIFRENRRHGRRDGRTDGQTDT